MGSTTIAVLHSGSKLAMAHIGDSRAYLLRDGTFTQITKDHSFVQQLVDEARITQEEATGHPQRSLVTRVMTGNPDDHPDLSVRELHLGDRYLLCSDGLSDFVSADVIQEILTKAPNPDEAADRLVEVAVRASARDNITVVLADVVDLDSQPATDTVPQVVGAAADRKRRRRTRAIPISPAEKAAALTREVAGAPGEDEPVTLAEESRGHRTRWLRWAGLAAVVVLVVVGRRVCRLPVDPAPVLRRPGRRVRRRLPGGQPDARRDRAVHPGRTQRRPGERPAQHLPKQRALDHRRRQPRGGRRHGSKRSPRPRPSAGSSGPPGRRVRPRPSRPPVSSCRASPASTSTSPPTGIPPTPSGSPT